VSGARIKRWCRVYQGLSGLKRAFEFPMLGH